jgi:LysR family glycine cleavage system transcriptional activator
VVHFCLSPLVQFRMSLDSACSRDAPRIGLADLRDALADPTSSRNPARAPRLELRILTASTPIEQFRMDVDAVISGPARQPGWVGKPFLREARLPVLSPELLRKCPLRAPADLERHTLLHAATLREAWPHWFAAANVSELKPASEQVFEHFYFAIQAALEGLGVIMGPVALISDELCAGRLVAPIRGPVVKTRGYFFYAPERMTAAPAVAAIRASLMRAGRLTESEFRSLSLGKRVLTRRSVAGSWALPAVS